MVDEVVLYIDRPEAIVAVQNTAILEFFIFFGHSLSKE